MDSDVERRRHNDRLAEIVGEKLQEHEVECAARQARVDEKLKSLVEDMTEIKSSLKWVLTSILGSFGAFAAMKLFGVAL